MILSLGHLPGRQVNARLRARLQGYRCDLLAHRVAEGAGFLA
jgi:hypothetical protein